MSLEYISLNMHQELLGVISDNINYAENAIKEKHNIEIELDEDGFDDLDYYYKLREEVEELTNKENEKSFIDYIENYEDESYGWYAEVYSYLSNNNSRDLDEILTEKGLL